ALAGARRGGQRLAFLGRAGDQRRGHRGGGIEHRRGRGAGGRGGDAVLVGGGGHHLDQVGLIGFGDQIAGAGGAGDVAVGRPAIGGDLPLIGDRVVALAGARRGGQRLAFLGRAGDQRRGHRGGGIEHRRGRGAGGRGGDAVLVGGGGHHLD